MTDSSTGFAVFGTALGHGGLAWRGDMIVGSRLPSRDAARLRERLRAAFPDAREGSPPPAIRSAIDAVAASLDGEPADLSSIALDMAGVPSFHARVYDLARRIPPGETLTYGALARRLGEPGSARAVGQALGRNPFPPIVPCHRIIAADGKPGGFSAPGGRTTKERMLAIEGVHLEDPTLFDP